jgi:hypothetical protein
VSYAYKGHLTRAVTFEALRSFLTSVLVTPAKSRNWIQWLRFWTVDRVKPSASVLVKDNADAPVSSDTTPGSLVK